MARRVNTKFLIILTVVVVGVGMAGLVINRFFTHESPDKYLAMGQQAVAAKKYETAAKAYGRAVQLDPKRVTSWVSYGDVLNQLSPVDIEYLRHAVEAWGQALVLDPNNKPALERMMQYYSDWANLSPGDPATAEKLGQYASRLYAADPTNAAAEVAVQTSKIRPWLAGVEKDPQEVRNTIQQMEKLIAKYPTNADLPMFAAQAKVHLADQARQRDQGADAAKLTDEAVKIVDDAVKRSPTAAMYFSAAQVTYAQETLLMSDRQSFTQEKLDALRKKREGLYDKAKTAVAADDPLFTKIYISDARSYADRPATAEKILRELIAKRPDDQEARLALAEQLSSDPTKIPEALTILDRPFVEGTFIGSKALMVRELQVRTLVAAADLRMRQYQGKDYPAADRPALLKKISDGVQQVDDKEHDSLRALMLRGKLQLLQDDLLHAIPTLERAIQVADKEGVASTSGELVRWQAVDMLARAYMKTDQTGRAKDLLTQLVNRWPMSDEDRILLVEVLLKSGSYDDAQPHLAYLLQRRPDDPRVLTLQLQMLDSRGGSKQALTEQQKETVKQTFAKLPEETKPQVLNKINAAAALEMKDDAVRLLDLAQQKWPGDADVAKMGSRYYRSINDLPKARAYVDVAIKANPKDDSLQLLSKQLADMTPDALMKLQLDEADKNPDPVARALARSVCFRRMNKPEDALKELESAQQLSPKNITVKSQLFTLCVQMKHWDEAEALLPALSAANADQSNGNLLRYRLAMARGDYDSAQNYARTLTQTMSEFGQSWTLLGQVLQQTGQYQDAVSKYLTALQKQSDSPDALRGLVQCYYALNRPDDARHYIQIARQAMPDNAEFQEMDIQYQMNFGDPAKVIPLREAAAKKNPENPNRQIVLGQAYMATARSWETKPEHQKESVDMYAKARKTFHDGITKWPDELMFYMMYADACTRSKVLGDCEQTLKQLETRDAWKDKIEPQMLLAEFYAVNGRAADCQAIYEGLLKKDPKNVQVEVLLANLFLNTGKADQALKTLDANQQEPAVARRRVEILLALGHTEDAEQAVTDALNKLPSNLDLLHLGAGVDIQLGKYEQADTRVKRALEIDGKDPTTHYFAGLLEMRRPNGDLAQAVKELTIGEGSPDMGIEAKFAIADCMRRQNNPNGAIGELEGALAARPDNMQVRLALLDSYASAQPARWSDVERVIRDAKALPGYRPNAELLHREASMWLARGEMDNALSAIKEARAADPSSAVVARMYLSMLLKQRKYSDVVAEADKMVAANQNLWWAIEARAMAHRNLDQKEDAIKDFDAALVAANALHDDDAAAEIVQTMGDAMGPDQVIRRIQARAETDDRWKLMIARLQQTKGDTDAAIKTLEQVLARQDQLVPADRQNALRFGGTLYLIAHKPEQATQCYDALLKTAPDDMTALNNMAYLLGEMVQPSRPQEALKYSQRAYNLMRQQGRRDATVLDTQGWILTLNNQVDAGIDLLRSAVEVRSIPDSHYHLAEAYLRKEYADQAVRELQTARDLMKQFDENKTPYDQTLKVKIDDAMSRATMMQQQKKSTANVPIGTNVP